MLVIELGKGTRKKNGKLLSSKFHKDLARSQHVDNHLFLQEKLKPEYLELLPGKLKLFSQFLGDMKWFAGKTVFMLEVIYIEPYCLTHFILPFKNIFLLLIFLAHLRRFHCL